MINKEIYNFIKIINYTFTADPLILEIIKQNKNILLYYYINIISPLTISLKVKTFLSNYIKLSYIIY